MSDISDPTLAVGDLVFNNYSKNEFLWRITNIERRFLDVNDLKYGVYKNGKVGDEYSPLVTIETVANFSIKADLTKKLRKQEKTLDAAYLSKADLNFIQDHLQKLSKIISDLWL